MENDNIETLMEILNEIQFSDSKVMSDNHIVMAWKAVCSLDQQLKFKKINSQDKLIIFFFDVFKFIGLSFYDYVYQNLEL